MWLVNDLKFVKMNSRAESDYLRHLVFGHDNVSVA